MTPAPRVREAVAEVLSDPAYGELREGVVTRLLGAARRVLAQLLADLLGAGGAGVVGQVLLLLVPVALVGLAVLAVRRLGSATEVSALDASDLGVDPEDLLARADAAAAGGDHAAAVRARYAALVLLLDRAGVLRATPGTTVGEVDRVVADDLPAAAEQVAAGGAALARVVYGGRPATVGDAEAAGDAVAAVRRRAGAVRS